MLHSGWPICPPSWVHLGNSATTLLCCPHASSILRLDISSGVFFLISSAFDPNTWCLALTLCSLSEGLWNKNMNRVHFLSSSPSNYSKEDSNVNLFLNVALLHKSTFANMHRQGMELACAGNRPRGGISPTAPSSVSNTPCPPLES